MAAPPPGRPFQADAGEFVLRSLKPSDASATFTDWMSDPEVIAGMNLPPFDMTVEDLQNYIARADNRNKYLIGIFAKPEKKLIGFYQIDVNLLHRKAEMTAAIGDKAWWGKGVFKKTAGPLVDEFFKSRNIGKMSVRVTSQNKKILYSLMGSRFKHEGCLRQDVLTPDGRRLDVNLFARLKNP